MELWRADGGVSMERGAWQGRGLLPAAPSCGRRASTCCSGSSAASSFLARQVAGPTGGLDCGRRARRWRWSCGSSGTEGLCGVGLRA